MNVDVVSTDSAVSRVGPMFTINMRYLRSPCMLSIIRVYTLPSLRFGLTRFSRNKMERVGGIKRKIVEKEAYTAWGLKGESLPLAMNSTRTEILQVVCVCKYFSLLFFYLRYSLQFVSTDTRWIVTFFVKEYFVDTFSIEITFALVRSVDSIYLYVYTFMCSTCSVCSLKFSKENYILRLPTNYLYLHFVG